MMGRKKHHFLILCIPDYFQLKEYIRVKRSHGLIRMRVSKKGIAEGRYMYYTRKSMRNLNDAYKKGKKEKWSKYLSFGGGIPYVFDKVIDEKVYDAKKDKAISSIGIKSVDATKDEVRMLKGKIGCLKFPINSQAELARLMQVNRKTMAEWKEYLRKGTFKPAGVVNILSNGEKDNADGEAEEADDIILGDGVL
jgi:hypothetical protein